MACVAGFAAFIQTPARKSGQFVEATGAQSAIHRIGISFGTYLRSTTCE
jgi:hypothetical protein